jgi:hypothetical protein
MGFGMMGSSYGRGPFGYGMPMGWSIGYSFGGILATALGGAIFAWIYNAVNGGSRTGSEAREQGGSGIQRTA